MFERPMPVYHHFRTMVLRISRNLASVALALLVIVTAYKARPKYSISRAAIPSP
jgi:hypothetical protein